MSSLRDQLRSFASEPSPVLKVPTPELPGMDGQLFVRRATPLEWEEVWADPDQDNERARTVVLLACDSAGVRVFSADDALWLGVSPGLTPLVERLYWAGREHNGLTQGNREAWRKNSPGTAGSGSPCCSAAPCPPAAGSTGAAS
jgi:hypothetical protein